MWASLLARGSAALGKSVGFVNPLLYTLPASTLRDIIQGNNKMPPNGPGYDAGVGWDACTGLGSPGGSTLLSALSTPPDAGTDPHPGQPTPTPTPAHANPYPDANPHHPANRLGQAVRVGSSGSGR